VVLLDATMPGKSPVEALGELSKALPKVKTIIYTAHDNEDIINRLLSAGAWGFVSKNDNPESIVSAVRKASVA
jgi:DNA-binding NarL/FixJ family response regulator